MSNKILKYTFSNYGGSWLIDHYNVVTAGGVVFNKHENETCMMKTSPVR
jgi:hypothetical protein